MTPLDLLRDDAQAIFSAAIRAVQADQFLAAAEIAALQTDAGRPIRVAGMGKAAMAMAGVIEAELGPQIQEGTVAVPHGYPAHLPERLPAPVRIGVQTAGHPVPDTESLRAGHRLLAIAEACNAEDTLVVLISGGGSALAVAVPNAVELSDVQQVIQALLTSGAPIQSINVVRKHLSRIKGGQLARAAAPARVKALVVSDVVGDDLSTIASGPTVPDPSTFDEAIDVLREYDVWKQAPGAIRHHLEAGQEGTVKDTPLPGTAPFDHVTTELVATNRDALEAAARAAHERGYRSHVLGHGVTGEARDVARDHVETTSAHAGSDPVCLLWGGEPTVTVTGDGKGGRNQEAALSAALAMEGMERAAVFLSGGTDGIDGPTDAAGAWATPKTAATARRRGLDPRGHLEKNDAYPFFDALGQLLRPGPTHTNVMDVHVSLIAGEHAERVT